MADTFSTEELEKLVFITSDGLKRLNLDGKHLTHVPEGVMSMIDLNVLVLSNNSLEELPDSFSNLSQLKVLHLEKNRLQKFPDVIGALKNLIKLDFSHNRLMTIGEGIKGLGQLEELDLKDNILEEVPDVMCKLKNLRKLNISQNQLEKIPAYLKELQELDLSGNKLVQIPEAVFKLKKLLKLNVSGNSLSSIPDGIGSLDQLQELDVSDNKLVQIPEAVFKLKKLLKLNVSGNSLSSIPDGIGSLDQLQELDVSHNKLVQIPEAVSKLKKLLKLNVSGNLLSSIPDGIGSLDQLQELDVRGNKLVQIPEAVFKLKKLVTLNVSGNSLSSIPDGIGNLDQLQELDVRSNKLVQIPEAVFKLKKLVKLNVRWNSLSSIPDGIGNLDQLQELDVSRTKLVQIPEAVFKLKKLVKLNVRGNSLSSIPDGIGNLDQLQELDVSRTKLVQIPEAVFKLKKLVKLNVRGNSLSSIPDGIGSLDQLQVLVVSDNKLVQIPETVFKLKKLVELLVSKNSLSSIPDGIGSLDQLQVLDVRSNKLVHIPETVFKLKKLVKLDASDNSLSSIPDGIGSLDQLETLLLVRNKVQKLPQAICKLKELYRLEVSSNQLTSIPDNIAVLNKLQCLELRDNRLEEIPEAICQLENLSVLNLRENPLKVPPSEVCDSGLSSIRAYFLELRRGKTFHHKVVLLGASGAGKTSLANTLLNNKPSCAREEDRTIVLDRRTWEVERVGKILNITMADFGGNQWYQIVHHLFLDKDALILLVVNLERYSEKTFHGDVRCWLDVITSRVPKASVVLVGTHIDRLEDEEKTHCRSDQVLQDILCLAKDEDCQTIDIVSNQVYLVSSSLFTGIDVLRNVLIDFISKHGKMVPARWSGIHKKLQKSEIGMGQHFLTLNFVEEVIRAQLQDDENNEQELKAVVKSDKPISESRIDEDEMSQAEIVLTFFHDIGSLLWYKHSSEIRKFVFRRPEFLTELMKAVFSERLSTESLSYHGHFRFLFTADSFEEAKEDLLKRGIMSYKLLQGLWNHLDLESELFIAMSELLVQLDLCYPMDDAFDNRCLRFPWFLTEEAPKMSGVQKMLNGCPGQESHRLCLRYLYPARCPPPVYHTFVVRLHRHADDIKSRHEWKDGVYAFVGETEMLVHRSDQSTEKVISVSVEGSDIVEVWKVLLLCHQELKGVMSDWAGLRWECWIVCPFCIRRGITPPGKFKSKQLETNCPRRKVSCNRHNERIPACLVYPIKDGNDYRLHQEMLEEYKNQVKQKDTTCLFSSPGSLQNITYKSGSLSEKVLHCLSQDACACWKALGRQLGLTDNHLTQIEADNPGQTYEQCYVMLKAWYQARFPLTCEDLGRALQNINREDLVFKYCAVQAAPGFEESSYCRHMFSCPPSSECCHSNSESSIPEMCSDKSIITSISSEETEPSIASNTTLHTYLTNDTKIVRADVHHEAKPTTVFSIFGIERENHSSTSWANSPAENLITQVHNTFDSTGGELCSPDSNVRVNIPAGALPQNTSQPIFFGVVFDETELLQNIPETPQRTLICPVIKCGPSHVTFLKPVQIVLPHCLYLEEAKKYSISVYRCGEISDNPPVWESVPSSSEKTSQSMCWFKVKNDTIVIKTKCFSFWSVFACGGPKRKRASVFASRPSEDTDALYLQFFVYSDTEDSSKRVQAQAEKIFYDSARCTKEKPFKMYNDNKQIEVELSNLEDGWTLDKHPNKVIYPYESAYRNGFRVKDSCEFVVKPTRSDVEPFSCIVRFQQEDHLPEKTMYLNTGIKPGKSFQNNNISSTVESSFETGSVEDARQEASPSVRFQLDYPPEPVGSENELVTERHCLCIQEKVGVDWKKLLRKLDMKEEVIKIIDEENKQVTEKCYQGLIEWIKRSGSAEATTRKLCQELHSIGSSEAINALKNEGLLAGHGTAVSESSAGIEATV